MVRRCSHDLGAEKCRRYWPRGVEHEIVERGGKVYLPKGRPVTLDPNALDAAYQAFSMGERGTLRSVRRAGILVEYPGAPDPDAYLSLPTTLDDERRVIAEVVEAYLDALPDHSAAASEIDALQARIALLGGALGEIVVRSELGSAWTKADIGQYAYAALERDGIKSDG